MKNQRWTKFGGSFLIVLSLFVSSVAACVCSHHISKTETEVPSCHTHSEAKHKVDSSENVAKLDMDDDCDCLQPAPKAFSKSETIKIEKQTANLPQTRIEIKAVSSIASIETIFFEKSFYLSDSFYNIKSPRAPPRL